MKFMCEKHRQKLRDEPESAMIFWHKLMSLARYQLDRKEWRKSIISYGNALDAAQIVFENKPVSLEVNRYLRTASELIYTIRQCDYACDLQSIISSVKNHLEANLYPADINLLLRPLTDIAYSPLVDVHLWMDALFSADSEAENRQYH